MGSNSFRISATRNARPFDLDGRWGGEEFLGIIRNINDRGLEQMANRLRILIGESYVVHEKKRLTVTISAGATLARKDDTMASLIKRADTFLYEGKAGGSNRVTAG